MQIFLLQTQSDSQLDWDDTALTITINPMQDNVTDESSDSESSDSDDDEGKLGDVVNEIYANHNINYRAQRTL